MNILDKIDKFLISKKVITDKYMKEYYITEKDENVIRSVVISKVNMSVSAKKYCAITHETLSNETYYLKRNEFKKLMSLLESKQQVY